jgi:hypothetical protein
MNDDAEFYPLQRATVEILKAMKAGKIQEVVKAAVVGVCAMEMDLKEGHINPHQTVTLSAIYHEMGPEFERQVMQFVYGADRRVL